MSRPRIRGRITWPAVGFALFVGAFAAVLLLGLTDASGRTPSASVVLVVVAIVLGGLVSVVAMETASRRRTGLSWPRAVGRGLRDGAAFLFELLKA